MNAPPQRSQSTAIGDCLSDQARARISLALYDQVDSTNLVQLRELAKGAPSGSVCVAAEQTAGRGRGGRAWQSPRGNNLYCSLLWRFECAVAELGGLSLVAGVAVCRALTELGINPVRLKWPNDIVIVDDGVLRKLGGVLVQVESDRGCSGAVIGIGINGQLPVSAGQRIDQPWTDLAALTAQPPSRARLAAAVINHCVAGFDTFADAGLGPTLDEWRRLDALREQPVRVLIGAQAIDAQALGIDNDGALRCRLPDGKECSYASAEVSLRQA